MGGFRYVNTTVRSLQDGMSFLYGGKSYVAKTVGYQEGDIVLSAEEFDRANGDDLGLVTLRLSPQTRIRIMKLQLF